MSQTVSRLSPYLQSGGWTSRGSLGPGLQGGRGQAEHEKDLQEEEEEALGLQPGAAAVEEGGREGRRRWGSISPLLSLTVGGVSAS